jgi:hypothetical protein
MLRLIRPAVRRANVMAALALVMPLLFAFQLWSFSYFWTDDFGNIFWIQSETAGRMLNYVLNPASTFYRPLGELFYWILFHTFGLNPVPYHVVAWAIHAINTYLLFTLLRTWLRSPFAAIAGTIPFAFRVNFADMYWSFGTIYELLACLLMLIGTHLYVRSKRSIPSVLLLTFVYMLAVKSKEMAITLPAVWLLYEVFMSKNLRERWRTVLLTLALPLLAGAWFTYLKVGVMRDVDPASPYFMDITFGTAYQGAAQYMDWLTGVDLPPVVWATLTVGLFVFLLWRRSWSGMFFLLYVPLTFAPVIFLANHRWPYFWYIPFLGISGLFGLGARQVGGFLKSRLPLPKLIAVNATVLLVWAAANSSAEWYRSRATREYESSLAVAIRSYVAGLRSQTRPEPDATLFFSQMPPHFHEQVLDASVQVILGRPDLHARFVSEFPSDAHWKLWFADGVLHRIHDE